MTGVTHGGSRPAGDGEGHDFDGDELLSLPIVLGVGVLAMVGCLAYRRRSPKSQDGVGDRAG